ncbi:hypothetical protein [Nannocystis punicea]|uniref:Uncharacterized protein n=1 Tax=Nannocystis punicea TaxID=2995304 RepID=A0ABY7HD30_9BACT|nr:hypothetical protein [Nannocystis poenicansa]WAS97196.1 hypothetical protein O0S08_13695 [Nannocystis poenicansa]
MGTTPVNLHRIDGRKLLFTAADLEEELDTNRERIVEFAHLDVESDLRLLGGKLTDLPPDLARRLVASRSVWRELALAGKNGAHALADEYTRLLDEAAFEVVNTEVAKERAAGPKPRRGKAH